MHARVPREPIRASPSRPGLQVRCAPPADPGILFIYGLGSIIGRGKGTRGHVIYPQVPQAQGFLMDNEFRYARFQPILHKADCTVT